MTTAIEIVGVVVHLLTTPLLPEPLRSYVESDAGAGSAAILTLSVLLLISYFCSIIGLFLFWSPARHIYLAATVVAILANPFFGPTVNWGLGSLLTEAAGVLEGLLLGLIYWSPLSEEFQRK